MRDFAILRDTYSREGTFGNIFGANGTEFRAETVEDPWNDNQPFKSCIPDGTYIAKRTTRPKHGECWVLINPNLGITEWPTPGMRDSCLIHIANSMKDVEGCIGLGNRRGVLRYPGDPKDYWAVLESGGAIKRFMDATRGEAELRITIRPALGAVWKIPGA